METCLKTECIPFTAIPHNSRLFLDFFFDFDKTSAFYAHRPQASAVLENARTLNFPAERRVKVADVLERQNRQWGASAATLASIERLRKFHQASRKFATRPLCPVLPKACCMSLSRASF